MTLAVTATNANASSFPDVEVSVDDLLRCGIFRTAARWGSGALDCLGVMLEVYRRGGIGLPDPAARGATLQAFMDLFEEVTTPDQLFDVIDFPRGSHHVAVVHRLGSTISAKRGTGVYVRRLSRLRALSGLRYYRLRTDVYPV